MARFLPPATKVGQGYIFTGVCDSVHKGGRAWLPEGRAWLWGVCMVVRGCAWLPGGVCDCPGVCVVAGGKHGCWGVCMVAGVDPIDTVEGVCNGF